MTVHPLAPIGIAARELDTPCLLLDADQLERNVARMAELARAAGVKLRPHAKTHKLIEVAERQLAAGAAGLTVAKLGEAELFAGSQRPATSGRPAPSGGLPPPGGCPRRRR